MRKLAATYLCCLSQRPIKNGILVCDDLGTVIEIIDRGDQFREEAGVEFYSGIIVPGFIQSCDLTNLDKPSGRKLWAAGIALAADLKNNVFAAIEKNKFFVHELPMNVESKEFNFTFDSRGSIPEQLLAMQKENPKIGINELLIAISLQKAEYLDLAARYGRFDPGTRPGVNLITGVDFKNMQFTAKTKIKALL